MPAKKEESEKITGDMPIGDIIRKKPESAKIMYEYGLHCIGCRVSEWESLEEGCMTHGISKKETEEMIKKINKLNK